MNREAVQHMVVAALHKIAPDVDPARIDPDEDLREQTDIDSMDFLNLVVALHESTGVEVPEVDYPLVATLGGLVDYLAGRVVTTG